MFRWLRKMYSKENASDIDKAVGNIQKSSPSKRTKVAKEFLVFSAEEATTATQPQLCLFYDNVSIAVLLTECIPNTASQFLRTSPEIIEFADGKAAVRFFVQNSNSIALLVQDLFRVRFTSERDAIVSIGGFVTGIPTGKQVSLLQTLEVPQAVRTKNAIMW